MNPQKLLMVNLEDHKAKSLAKVISNKTAMQILDFLSQKEDAPSSAIAKELSIPLSTVEYNLQQLVEADLIETKHFQYSEKGKKVDLYSIANKLIIIAPKHADQSWKDKLSGILPAALVSVSAGAAIYYYMQRLAEPVLLGAAKSMALESASFQAADLMQEAPVAAPVTNAAFWFVAGAFLVLLFLIVYKLFKPANRNY